MGTDRATGLTYDDLLLMPETNRFQELVDGELVVSPSPEVAHQTAVVALMAGLAAYARDRGGLALVGPMDVLVEPSTVVQPDLLYLRPERVDADVRRPIRVPPDLVVEVLSPSNRAHDLVRKRGIYERFGVPELWFVDHEVGEITVLVFEDGAYREATVARSGDVVRSPRLDGFAVEVAAVLGAGGERSWG
jgi:Uma2 family endonuclease